MPLHDVDNFTIFAGSEHMFFGVREPFSFMRDQTEKCLREQKEETILAAVKAYDTPKFFTMGRKTGNGKHMLVTHFGACYRARLHITNHASVRSEIDSTLTFLFGDVHLAGSEKSRNFFDFQADAGKAFQQQEFQRRFLLFRVEECAPGTDKAAPSPRPWWKFW